MGDFRSSNPGAKKFRGGSPSPGNRWWIYTYSAVNHLVCTCRNLHAWYYCRFDPAFYEDEFTATFPENAGIPENFQLEQFR